MVKFGDKVTIIKNKYFKGKKGIVVGHYKYGKDSIAVSFRMGRLYNFQPSEIKKGW